MVTNEPSLPHCGVCKHVTFTTDHDWNLVPYCTTWERPTRIRVGTICDAFGVSSRDVDQVAVDKEVADSAERPADEKVELDAHDRLSGSRAPFYPAYTEDGESRYGCFCANCTTLDVVMDTMGRIECTRCGNTHKSSEWDLGYL